MFAPSSRQLHDHAVVVKVLKTYARHHLTKLSCTPNCHLALDVYNILLLVKGAETFTMKGLCNFSMNCSGGCSLAAGWQHVMFVRLNPCIAPCLTGVC